MMMITITPPVYTDSEVWYGALLSFGMYAMDGMIPGTTPGMDGTCLIIIMDSTVGLTGDGAGIIIPDGIADGDIMATIVTVCHTVLRWLTVTMAREVVDI